jgi:lactoylglutathione lyase
MHLAYFGIRVTDMQRSYDFYTRLFGLTLSGANPGETPPGQRDVLLLLDEKSGQRLELNYYPPGNPYSVPYLPGEGLDHVAFKVDDLEEFLGRLRADGYAPEKMAHYDGPMFATPEFRVAYVRDPDGNQLELFDAPKERNAPFDLHAY